MSKRRRLIVLMGLDGSGKSTQAALLAQMFKDRGVKAAVVWMRGESYLTLPVLKIAKTLMRAPKAGKRGATGDGAAGGGAAASGAAGGGAVGGGAVGGGAVGDADAHKQYAASKRSLFRKPIARSVWRRLALLDFYITYRLAFGRLARDTSVVILDRYLYDSLIDIDTAFGSKGAEVKRLLGSASGMVPRPDRVVLIDITPAEAMRRKDDIPSMAYLEERTGLYRIAADHLGASIVDGTRSIEAVRSAIAKAVGDLLPAEGRGTRAGQEAAREPARRDGQGTRDGRRRRRGRGRRRRGGRGTRGGAAT